ncbi:MAG: hypothetical protein K9N46_09740 [Candidatus Marinimicrobia bacterium]|nr:hypothetical protein [Candidatus Neomarinimicrobiota bacterium]MCF7828399.1 hypothetical protein [Candidatus Neomarinimicrobiota bacterium]MCF7881007.1 hypothetical protein [Candidatus Neomarinimicrobiota bacterium]
MATPDRRTAWLVYGTIALAGLIIVFLNFSPQSFSGSQDRQSSNENINREALAKIAPTMSGKAYHRRFESEKQCITCHTQGVMDAKIMPHEPRENCMECHKIKEEA